ncbi:unnamed protein product [Calypogeia fissa]
MENLRGILLAFALLLAFATTGPDLSVHARVPAGDWSIPYNSNHVDRPMNLSGNSVGEYFDTPVPNYKSAAENEEGEEGLDGKTLEYLPGFDTVNGMGVDVLVECYSQNLQQPLLVHELIAPGERQTWPVSVIDPRGPHVTYVCVWSTRVNYLYREVSRVVWADTDHQNLMPFYCVDCIWKVNLDGLYLWNLNFKFFVRIMGWQ